MQLKRCPFVELDLSAIKDNISVNRIGEIEWVVSTYMFGLDDYLNIWERLLLNYYASTIYAAFICVESQFWYTSYCYQASLC